MLERVSEGEFVTGIGAAAETEISGETIERAVISGVVREEVDDVVMARGGGGGGRGEAIRKEEDIDVDSLEEEKPRGVAKVNCRR